MADKKCIENSEPAIWGYCTAAGNTVVVVFFLLGSAGETQVFER